MSEKKLTYDADWLRSALNSQIALPKFAPDEPIHLQVLRLLPIGDRRPRLSLSNASLVLLEEFCEHRFPLSEFDRELLHLVASLRSPEAVSLLHSFALTFFDTPEVSIETRQAVLIALMDMHSALSSAFWQRMMTEDPKNHSGIAFAATLSANPTYAINFLPQFPEDESIAQYLMAHLDLVADKLIFYERKRFLQQVEGIVHGCQPSLARCLKQWLSWKSATPSTAIFCEDLEGALLEYLGSEKTARALTPKLCEQL